MVANAVVQARVEKGQKAKATQILARVGLTPSSAYRLMLRRIVEDEALPFCPFCPITPGPKTSAAMNAPRDPKAKTYANFRAILEDLDAED